MYLMHCATFASIVYCLFFRTNQIRLKKTVGALHTVVTNTNQYFQCKLARNTFAWNEIIFHAFWKHLFIQSIVSFIEDKLVLQ